MRSIFLLGTDLAVPIADVTSFNNLVQAVIDDNPFGCVGYTGADGQPVAAVVRNREHYTAKVNFLDGEGKRVGNVSLQSPSIAAFEANAAEALANAALAAAMGGEAVRNGPGETYYCQLKCHDPSDVSKTFDLLPLLPRGPVATPTSPSPGRPSGSRPTRTTPSGTRSRPGPTPSGRWSEGNSSSRSIFSVSEAQNALVGALSSDRDM